MTTLQQAISIISAIDINTIENGKYQVADDFYYNVFEYEPKPETEIDYEAHRKYIDIQCVARGVDKLMVTDIHDLKARTEYDAEKDVIFYHNNDNQAGTILRPGSIVVLYPKDAHKSVNVEPGVEIKKIVGKLLVR